MGFKFSKAFVRLSDSPSPPLSVSHLYLSPSSTLALPDLQKPFYPFLPANQLPVFAIPCQRQGAHTYPVVQFSKHLTWSSEAGHPASRPSCGGTACPGGKILLPAPYTSSLHTHSRTLSFASFFLILSHPGYSFYILGCYIPCI